MARDVRVTLSLENDSSKLAKATSEIRNAIAKAVSDGMNSGMSKSSGSTNNGPLQALKNESGLVAARIKALSDRIDALSAKAPEKLRKEIDALREALDRAHKASEFLDSAGNSGLYGQALKEVEKDIKRTEETLREMGATSKAVDKQQAVLAKEARTVAEAMERLAKATITASEGNEKFSASDVELITGIQAKKKALENLVAEYNMLTSTQNKAGDETDGLANRVSELNSEMAELAHSIVSDEALIEQAFEKSNNAIKEKIALEKQLVSESKVLSDTILKLARANQQLAEGTAKVSEKDVITIRLIQEKKRELAELSDQYIRLSYEQGRSNDQTEETTAELKRLENVIGQISHEIAQYEDDLLAASRASKKLADDTKELAAENKRLDIEKKNNANALASEIQKLTNAQERASRGHAINKINVIEEAQAYLANKVSLQALTKQYQEVVAEQRALNASQDSIAANTKGLRAEIEKVTHSIAEYESRIRSTNQSDGIGHWLGSFSSAFFKMQAIILAVGQIGQAIQFVTTQLLEGAAVLQSRESFFIIAGSGTDKLLADVRRASSGLLAENELLKTSTALIAGTTGDLRKALAGSADEIVTIARAAIKVNPAISERYGGLEGVTARLVEGIRKQEVELFDEFRIIVRLGDAVKQYANEHGKAASALTLAERQQAFLNAVLEQGDVLVNQLNGDLGSQTDAYTLLGVKVTNLKTDMQALLAEGFLPIVNALAGANAQDAFDLVSFGNVDNINAIKRTLVDFNAIVADSQDLTDESWLVRYLGMGINGGTLDAITGGIDAFGDSVSVLLKKTSSAANGDLIKFLDLLESVGPGTATDIGKNFAPELARELALLTTNADHFIASLESLGVSTGQDTSELILFAKGINISELALEQLLKKIDEYDEAFRNGDITRTEMLALEKAALFEIVQTYEILTPAVQAASDAAGSFDVEVRKINAAIDKQAEIATKAADAFSEQYFKSFSDGIETLLKSKDALDSWDESAIKSAIAQKATSEQLGNLVLALGVFTDAEYQALVTMAQFDAEVAQAIATAGAAGTGFSELGVQIEDLAVKYNIAAVEQELLLQGLERAANTKYENVFKDTLDDILDSKTGMEEWIDVLRRVTDEAGLNSQQTIALATSMGLLSDSEIEAANNAASFESQLALLIGQAQIANPTFAGVGDQVLALAADFNVAARAAAYFSEAQRGAFLQGFLNAGAGTDRNVLRGFAGGLIRPSGGGGGSSPTKKETDAIAAEFVSLLTDITENGIDKFREEMLSTEKGLSGLEKSLFDVAIAGGASVDQIRALTDALGRGEDAAEAFRALAAQKGIESIVEQFLGGTISAEQAAEGVRLLNEQLASGQDIDLSSLGIDLSSVAAGVKAVNEAVGSGGGAAEQVRNWMQELVTAAEGAGAGVDTLTELARKAGYTEQEIMDSLAESLLSEAVSQLGNLAEGAGADVAADLLAGFQNSLGDASSVDEVSAIGKDFFANISSLTVASTDQVGTWRQALLEAGVEAGLSTTAILELAKAQDDYSESALTSSLRAEAMRIQVENLVKKLQEGVPVADVLGEQDKFNNILAQLEDAESIARFIDNLVNGDSIKQAFNNAVEPIIGSDVFENIENVMDGLFRKKQKMDIEIKDKELTDILEDTASNNGDGYSLLYDVDQDELRRLVSSALSDPFLIELSIRSDAIAANISNAISKGVQEAVDNLPRIPSSSPPNPQTNRSTPRSSAGGASSSTLVKALGGPIYGPSHMQGGVIMNAEGGEYVVPRWMATPEFVAEMERVRLSNNRNVPIPSVSMISNNSQMVSVPSVNNSSTTSISSSADRTTVVNNYYYGSGDTQRVARPTLTEMSGQ